MVPSCTDVYDSELAIQGREVARLIMTHIAQYWGLGSTMLRKFAANSGKHLTLCYVAYHICRAALIH